MEENILTAPPNFKLYKQRSIYIATLLGGPLGGGYLIAENYKKLGEKANFWKTWIITILATILIFALAFLMPGTVHVPGYIIPLLYAGLTSYLVKKLQGDKLKLHMENNGEFYSLGRAIVISIVGLAIIVGIILFYTVYFNESLI